MTDTFQRSCNHWSEAKQEEMEDFYALASVDYRHLAQALDWQAWLTAQQARVVGHPLRLLDVACGSGKFPVALTRYGGVTPDAVSSIDYGLLDPSAFSIDQARQALSAPFMAGKEYQTTLQALDCPRGAFDIVWATHALYALPVTELQAGLERFMHALKGVGFIAHACEDSHYLRFYRHFLEAFHKGQGTPYTSAEQIVAMLEHLGVTFEAREITYENGAPDSQRKQVQGYLQRCVFDDSISLDQMLANLKTGNYLATCRRTGEWKFSQRVMLIFINHL